MKLIHDLFSNAQFCFNYWKYMIIPKLLEELNPEFDLMKNLREMDKEFI